MSAECSSISECVNAAKAVKQMLQSKVNPFHFITAVNLDLSLIDLTPYETYVDTKLKTINYYLDNSLIPPMTDNFVNTKHLGPYSYNFAVLPIYKKKITEKNVTEIDNIKLFEIEKVKLIIGFKLIEQLKPREVTSILLHEIGHIVAHISESTQQFIKILKPIHSILKTTSVIPILHIISLPLFLIVSRSLFFTSHMEEYNADKFAVECGYGSEMRTVLILFKNATDNKQTLSFSEIMKKIHNLFVGSSHPDFKDRIDEISNVLKTGFEKQYNGIIHVDDYMV